ncbi:MAG: dihydrodipicolinate synthase family protein [Planctomycetota bacterium]|nr:dihydrodipicolinate synthase family protein [Planctomycetota bacterium]
MALTRENFTGPWAGLPVAWTEEDRFDEPIYRADVARCCGAGVPGVYTGGTTGEFYVMEFDEFKDVARATVEECRAHEKPVMIGCTSTYTLGAARRAAYAAEIGADAIQVALPYWMEIGDEQIVPFFKEVVDASDGLPLSIYETTRAKKVLTLDQHRAIKDAVPSYLMVKANGGTLGYTPEGCRALSELVNVFVSENKLGELGRVGARGSCSSLVYSSPSVVLSLWQQVERQDWTNADATCRRIDALFEFYDETFASRGFTDTAEDRLGGVASGFLRCGTRSRGPYPVATPNDVETLRRYYREHFPEML